MAGRSRRQRSAAVIGTVRVSCARRLVHLIDLIASTATGAVVSWTDGRHPMVEDQDGSTDDRGSRDPRGFVEASAGGVLRLTLDRPDRRNALTVELVAGLADRLLRLRAEPEVRVVVLAGGPPVFCAGGDLTDMGRIAEQGPLAVTDMIYSQFQRLVAALGTAPVPVIALVDGAALGAGLDLAMACDLRVASTRAVFASSWIGVGLIPGMGGAHLLTRAIGSTRARELVLLGDRIDARTALDWGVVNRVAAPAQLEATLAGLTDRLISLPAAALDRSKASLHRAAAAGLAEELATMGAVQGALLTGPDFRERTARFR
jgi:2-(1,2-epoxy-1,2-dihydrophenyl)acetyl-CoA isomerase